MDDRLFTLRQKDNGMDEIKVKSKHIDALPWLEFASPKTGLKFRSKSLLTAKESGIDIQYVNYPKGYTTVWHTHNCSHGIYVLEGILKTHEGLYGPGSFVWFPEGLLMEHGATDEEDVAFLFITNKPFDIDYK
jgi:quercetin dioxygenase-like cupin family protein